MSQVLELLERHLAAENAHHIDDTLATLTDDCVFVDRTLQMTWTGHAGAAAHYTMWWDAFDTEVVGEQLHLGTDSAVAETTWRGTNIGEFLGFAATGRSIELSVAVVVEFRDELMAGERFSWDSAQMAHQLGVAAMPVRAQRLGDRIS